MIYSPIFSILVPAYKACFLSECIESILGQTYKEFQLVIVNDNSPEDLDSIVGKYNDPRLLYYKNEKGYGAINVVDNWNQCLAYANGDFVICMGDDDKLTPTCLEQYIKIIKKYPTLDVYHARFELIDETSNVHRINYIDQREEYESTFTLLMKRYENRLQYIGDHLFRTSSLRARHGFVKFPCAWFSDEVSVAMMAGEKGIASTEGIAFQYRISNKNITNNTNLTKYKLDASDKAREWYLSFINNNESFSDTQRRSLRSMMEVRINQTKNSCIAFDMSFHPIAGLIKWHGICSDGQLFINFIHGIRGKVSRYFHRIF